MRQEDQIVELLKRISDDIHAVRIHTTRLARDSYRQDLERVASTPERQEMWRLCDGILSNEEIAKKVGVSLRTVQYFVQDGEKADLVTMVRRGYPKRTEDYDVIPPEWKPYRKPAVMPEAPPSQSSGGGSSQ